MKSAKEFFGGLFGSTESTAINLISPFSLRFNKKDFTRIKTEVLFKKILHRCYSRSEGADDEEEIQSLFDSSESSNAQRGLISLLAVAMTNKSEIAIIYDSGVVRLATHEEKQKIQKDYKEKAKSDLGVLVDFRNYVLADLVQGYMAIVFDILSSMNTQVGLAKALQLKMSSLRGLVGANGKEDPINQAKEINEALKGGRSVLMDKNDSVEVLPLNSQPVKDAITLVYGQLASDLGMPLSFVNGELATGMSATGEADTNQQEEGLQDFFNSIFKPVTTRLYDWDLRFISDDWRYFSAMIGSLIIVENSSLLSQQQKQAFADRLMPMSNAKAKK